MVWLSPFNWGLVMIYFETMSLQTLSGLLVRHISFHCNAYSIFKLVSYSSTFTEVFSGLGGDFGFDISQTSN